MNFSSHFLVPGKIISMSLFGIIVINLAFLNWIVLKYTVNQKSPVSTLLPTQQVQKSSSIQESDACGANCIKEIYETIHLATASVNVDQTKSSDKYITTIPLNEHSASVKEFYISFGTGTNNTDDWADVSGLSAYINSNLYGIIRKVTFEASLYIPTGNQKAYARLFNVSDKHPVWFSEVSLEGGTPQLLISSPITLDEGNKLYQVQMKTSLKYQTNLTQSRLHIMVQ